MYVIIKHNVLGTKPSPAQAENVTKDCSYKTVDSAFSKFVDKIFDVLNREDFRKVRRKCIENLDVPGGISLSTDIINKIHNANDLYDLFDVTCLCKPYWNWMNIRLIEKMGISEEAEKLIVQYKNEVFSRKVKDLMLEISYVEVPTDKYTEVKDKLNKEFDNLRIKDVVKRWGEIEKILEAEGSMLFKAITAGCVEICWLLPNDLVERAVYLATSIQFEDQSATNYQEFYFESLSLKIGDVIIKDTNRGKL